MKKNKTILTLLLGSILTACSSTTPVESNVVVEPIPYSDVCCTKFSELPFIQLATNEELDFRIDPSADAAAFKDGNSYFNAFQLADRSAVVTVSLSSIMADGEVFAPKMVMLDENFNPVDETTLDQFDIKTSDAFTKTRYTSDFKIDGRKTPYFVIYTPEDYLGKTVQVEHPARVRAKEMGEAMPMVTDPRYVHSHNGQLSLEVKTISFKAAKIRAAAKPVPAAETKTAAEPKVKQVPAVSQAQPETVTFYYSAIKKAVAENNIPKALSLLDEAKALGIKGAQEAFVEAVNTSREAK